MLIIRLRILYREMIGRNCGMRFVMIPKYLSLLWLQLHQIYLNKSAVFAKNSQIIWSVLIFFLSLQQKTIGLQNTASDCSSGGKGSEVLFLDCKTSEYRVGLQIRREGFRGLVLRLYRGCCLIRYAPNIHPKWFH